MKHAVDLSHHNDVSWKKLKTDLVLYKATEGITFKDPTFVNARGNCKSPFYSYHFCGGGDPIEEAKFYLDNGKADGYALDYEIYLKDPVTWCKKFLDYVAKETGKTPLLYINASTCNGFDWTPCTKYPLWIAAYNYNTGVPGTEPKTGAWKDWTLWQYTSRGATTGVNGVADLNLVRDSFFPSKIEPVIIAQELPKPQNDTQVPVLQTNVPTAVETSNNGTSTVHTGLVYYTAYPNLTTLGSRWSRFIEFLISLFAKK